jgi:hypothetical protein
MFIARMGFYYENQYTQRLRDFQKNIVFKHVFINFKLNSTFDKYTGESIDL